MAFGWAGTSLGIITNTLGLWFDQKRGMAISLALNGASFGGIVGVPLLVAAIGHFDFPGAMIASAIALVVLMVPVILLFVGRPPAGLSAATAAASADAPSADAPSASKIRGQAFRDIGFLHFGFAVMQRVRQQHVLGFGVLDDSSGDIIAVFEGQRAGLVLFGDDLRRLDDGLENVLPGEACEYRRDVRADRAAFVAKAVAGETLGRGEGFPALGK